MNNQIDTMYDGQATYPDTLQAMGLPTTLEAAPKTRVKPRPVYRKKPVLTTTEYQATPKTPANLPNLSDSLDHYLFW